MADAPQKMPTGQSISGPALQKFASKAAMTELLLFEAREQIAKLTAERDEALRMAADAGKASVAAEVIGRGKPANIPTDVISTNGVSSHV